jgi:hypothetical protein
MMISWLVTQLTAFFSWVIGNLPAPTVPTWLTGLDSAVSALTGFVNQLQAWIPSTLALVVLSSLVVAIVVSIGARIARMVLSLFTGGGGNAN